MKLLFYVSKLYSIPVVSPLFSEASARGIRCAFFVSDKVSRNMPGGFRRAPVFTALPEARGYEADFVLCPGNFVDFRIPGRKVELFHGIGVEKPSHYRIRHFFDYYFTSGPVVTERFLEMERKYRYFKTFETGWPKIDHIRNYDSGNIREKYSIPPDRKVILYAPTHSSGMESAGDIVQALDRVVRSDEIWLCKPHEFANLEIPAELEQVRIIHDYDITPYLHLADVLVGDTSSVIYEFMVLNKPVVTFRTMDRTDKGINIDTTDQLRAALDRSLRFPGEFAEQRAKHLAEVNPILNGTISEGIVDLLLSLDPDAPAGSRKKPLNLFRKMQIIYHGMFRKGYLR